MKPSTRSCSWAALEFLGLLLLTLAGFSFLLSGDRGPLEMDFGGIFLPPLFQVRAALLDGSLLYWDAERYGGTPYWALPNTAPAYPPLLLALLLREPLGATNLVVLAHLLAGAWGTRALARKIGVGRFAAFVAAAAYLYAPLTRQLGSSQPWAIMAFAYVPWTLLQVVRLAGGADWRACGITAGLLFSGTTWCGGYMMLLPGLMSIGLLALFFALRKPLVRELGRAAGMLFVMMLVFVAASAGRMIPTAAWMELTNRSQSLSLQEVIANSLSFSGIVEWALWPGFIALGLVLVALGAALARRRPNVLPVFSTVLVLMLLSTGLPQRAFLYEWVPGFDRVRDPRNFWSPLMVLVPVLMAIGFDIVSAQLARKAAWPAGPRAAFGAIAVAAMCVESARWGAPVEARIVSLQERLEANALHCELARRAQEEPLFRVHHAQDTRPKLKKTANLLRSALGLESVEGLIGNISIAAYDMELILPSRDQGPRLWGLMNCVYVTSEEPLSKPELELVSKFDEDPNELFRGTDGPYLYRNHAAQARAYLAPRAVLLLDAERIDRTRMLLSRIWSPQREVLVTARSDEIADALLQRFDVVLDVGAATAEDLAPRLRALGARVAPLPPQGEIAELVDLFGNPPERVEPLPDPERGWNRAVVSLTGDAGPSWLVLAETYAIYPGWRASVDGVDTPLLVANGATTTLPLPAGAREVVFTFTPPGLELGMALSAATLVVSALTLRLLRPRGMA